MKEFPLAKVYHWIEPGPVVLVATALPSPKRSLGFAQAGLKGRANLMTMSWLTMMDFDPPLIGCSLGPWDYSHTALRKTKECVIAIPGADLMTKVVEIGNCSGRDVDKFKKFGLTALPAKLVKPPLVAECLANFECRVADEALAAKYNFHVLKVVKAWINPARKERRIFHAGGDGTFSISGRRINLKRKMTKWQDMP